jgi:uncharacterized protein YodC (DUF2158 family)
METEQFKVGDTVQLKSGGPIMTIHYQDSTDWYCVWFKENQLIGNSFDPNALKKINPDETHTTITKITR